MDPGVWGLFCGPGGKQVILIGDTPCGPVSARKALRTVPRRLLLDDGRISQAYSSNRALVEMVEYSGVVWRVIARPMRSPRTQSVIGVLGGVFIASDVTAPEPEIGMWEWEIDRDSHGLPTSQRRAYWDQPLFDIYNISPVAEQQSHRCWEVSKWANELVDPADRMRVNSLIRDGVLEELAGGTNTLKCLTYHVLTGYGSQQLGRRHLRLVGSIARVEDRDPVIFLRGFSYPAPTDFLDLAFEQNINAGRVDDALRGVMELTREPMAIVDIATLDLLMTSTSWRDSGFDHNGGFGVFAASDTVELRRFLHRAAVDSSRFQQFSVILRRADGLELQVNLQAIGIRSGGCTRDVVIRLDLPEF